MVSKSLALFAALTLSQAALAENSVFNDDITRSICKEGMCTFFRVSMNIRVDMTGTGSTGTPVPQTRVVVNNKVYTDDDGQEYAYSTKVIRGTTTCEKAFTVDEHQYRIMAAVINSIVTPEGEVTPILSKTQQAYMGFYLSLIDEKSSFECSAADLSNDR